MGSSLSTMVGYGVILDEKDADKVFQGEDPETWWDEQSENNLPCPFGFEYVGTEYNYEIFLYSLKRYRTAGYDHVAPLDFAAMTASDSEVDEAYHTCMQLLLPPELLAGIGWKTVASYG